MKVLILHNSYKIQGGEDISTLAEVELLRQNNIQTDTYYVSNKTIDESNTFKIALNAIWSRFQYRAILKKIRKENYDIVHVQNFFPLLSPSIFYALKKSKAKVVMSVRNYRLICPNAILYVDGAICRKCVSKKMPIAGFYNKCYRRSYAASSAVVAMLSFHNFINTWKHKIDAFVCVSYFVKNQLIAGGFEPSKLMVKYNFVTTDIAPSFENGEYYIYSGRLSDEKGLGLLVEAFKNSDRKLFIVGDGPLRGDIESIARDNPNITYSGMQPLNDNYKLISNAKALIFPSKWHEPFGRTIVEAYAHGTPVIASALGGITEIVTENQNGFLFDPLKKDDLLRAIIELEKQIDITQMRRHCYETYRMRFLPSSNFKQIMGIYQQVLSNEGKESSDPSFSALY